MHRATPLGHDRATPPAAAERANQPNPAPPETPAADKEPQFARPFSVVRGGAPAERPQRRMSGEHRRRQTPARAVVQPSDPDRLRRALDAMKAMNKLTRERTEDLKKLSSLTRELSEQMKAFGSVIGGLKIGPQRRSVG
jgi:hypothetical protein